MAQIKHFDSAGVSIAYIDELAHTEAPPQALPVLLIHGFASNISMNWLLPGWVETLRQAGFRVIAYDNRGHGQSEKIYDLEKYGAPLMADDAARLLDHLGVARAHVMGYSMGARIAAFLTLQYPERVARLIFGGLGINMVRFESACGLHPPVARTASGRKAGDDQKPGARRRRRERRDRRQRRSIGRCHSGRPWFRHTRPRAHESRRRQGLQDCRHRILDACLTAQWPLWRMTSPAG